jgi:nitroreductase
VTTTITQEPVWRAIQTRRSVRDYLDRPLDDAHVERILLAGRRAASSKNQQRRAFVVVRDRERLQALSRVGDYAGPLAGAAMGVALVTEDPATANAPLSVYFDVGQAADSMMLAALEVGVGSVPITVYDQPQVKAILGLPDDRHCEFLVSFGYPADPTDLTRPPKPGGRLPLEALVHEERW